MSVWIAAAASSAVCPRRSVQPRASVSPAVKNVIRPSASNRRWTTSSSADSPSRNSAASSSGQLGQLGLELQVDPGRAVHDRDDRLRRQRLELGRQLALPVAQRLAGVQPLEHALQVGSLLAQLRVARLRLLAHALEAALDMVAVGDQQLQLEPLEVALRIGAAPRSRRPPPCSASTRRRFPSSCGPVPGTSVTRAAAGVTFAAETTAASCPSRSSAIGAMPTCSLPKSGPDARAREHVEERGLPRGRQTDDSCFQHLGP